MTCGLYIHTPFCETKCGYCDFYSVALKGRNTAPLVDAILRELDIRLAAVADLPITTIFIGGGTPTLLPIDDLARLLRRVAEVLGRRARPHGPVPGEPPASVSNSVVGGTTVNVRHAERSEASPGRRDTQDLEILRGAALAQDDGRRLGSALRGSLEEFTVEANPATVDQEKAELLAGAGVTRVSMGAQSFFPAELAALERLHSPDDIAPSVKLLRRAGIEQINLDLIFGIPGQTLDTWRESLRRAIDLGPDHIACYGLTYEPATRLTAQRDAGRVVPCDEDIEAEMFYLAAEVLERAGFLQYEISNYARPGCQCRHNLIYWRNEPYVGIGPSAAGCYAHSPPTGDFGPYGAGQGRNGLRKAAGDREPSAQSGSRRHASRGGTRHAGSVLGATAALRETVPPFGTVLPRRYKNVPDIARYVQMINATGSAEIEAETVEGETLILEMILMQLRLNEGLSIFDFKRRTGHDPAALFGDTLRRLAAERLVETSPTHIALTRSGRLLANRIMADLAGATQDALSEPRP